MPAVRYLALRPWHLLSEAGEIKEVESAEEAQRLRDDGYIVIASPDDDPQDEDGA